jgi:hypothetical protein
MRERVLELVAQYTTHLGGEFVVDEQAEKVLALLEEVDPDASDAWGRELKLEALGLLLRQRQHSQRRHARDLIARAGSADRISDAIERGSLRPFSECLCVDGKTWKRVAEMTGADHLYVAERHRQRAGTESMLDAFHRQIAKSVGTARTADVMDEETYALLLRSLMEHAS